MYKERKKETSKKITHEDLVKLYVERYFNEKGIKKYAKVDEEKVRAIISKIKEEYLELFYNAIKANDVQFSAEIGPYCMNFAKDNTGKVRTKVVAVMEDDEYRSFFHEMGHAVSICLNEEKNAGYEMLSIEHPQEGKLECVLQRELSSNQERIKEEVLQAHRLLVQEELGVDKYLSIAKTAEDLKEFNKLSRSLSGGCGVFVPSFKSKRQNTPKFKEDYARYEEWRDELSQKGVFAIRNELEHNPTHKKFRYDNEAILDLLSSVCDMEYPYDLQMHKQKYFKRESTYQVRELWANLFSVKVTGREDLIDEFKKYLPKTYSVFEYVLEKVKAFYCVERMMRRW